MKKMVMTIALIAFFGFGFSQAAVAEGSIRKEVALASQQGFADDGPIGMPSGEENLKNALLNQTVNPITNPVKAAIKRGVEGGVSVNTILLVLMFPLTAALVAFSRQVIGVQGFGLFTPAVVSVAFLATGVVSGLLLFLAILAMATLGRIILRKLIRLPYLPRMAVLIWFVSLGVLAVLLLSPLLNLRALVNLGIFPILLFTLLAETFIDAQITRSIRAASVMTLETIVLAIVAYFLMSSRSIQETVLFNPEPTMLAILAADLVIGRYKGLRVMEVWRFKKLISS